MKLKYEFTAMEMDGKYVAVPVGDSAKKVKPAIDMMGEEGIIVE